MSKYEYKCLTMGAGVQLSKKQGHNDLGTACEELLNKYSEEGWDLVTIDEVASVKQPGCIGRMFGRKHDRKFDKLVIFRREI